MLVNPAKSTSTMKSGSGDMNQEMYKVVLSGKFLNNAAPIAVKQRMAAIFKTSGPVIDKLFARPNTVVKKDLTIEKANQYVRAIEKAGAACYLKKMAPPGAAPAAAPETVSPTPNRQEPADTSGPSLRVIPVQTTYKGEERFFPKQIEGIAASSNGLNLKTDDLLDVPYNRITALAAYSPSDAGSDVNGSPIHFLIFLKNMERPFIMDSRLVDYASFQENPPSKSAAAFRGFLHFLCRQNTGMILEETTFDFISGNELPVFDNEKAMKYVTAIGMLIEAGGEGEEG